MKYIKGYLLLGLTLILGSCSDFLDRDPDQILTNDQIFSDAKMINSVLAGFYGDTENWGQSFATPASFTKVDDGCVTDGGRDNMQEYSDNQWRVYPYKYIRNLNQFLAGLRATTVLESTEKLRYEGEIRFLRAWAYFSMCRGLGGVPIVNDNVYEYEAGMDVSGLAVPRSKESEVYDYIINECATIADYLPTKPTINAARATRWAALMLKARAAVYAGSLANYNNKMVAPIRTEGNEVGIPAEMATPYYETALEAAKEVITQASAYYNLDITIRNDLGQNFYNAVCVKENNHEVIWAKDYAYPGATHGFTQKNIPASLAEDQERCYSGAVLNLVEAFEYKDNRDGTIKVKDESGNYIMYSRPEDAFANKDARLWGTVLYPGAKFRGRKVILDLMQKTLDKQLDCQQKNSKGKKINHESFLHNILFSQHSDDPLDSNLWMINDDFIHYKGISESELRNIKVENELFFREDLTKEELEELTAYNRDKLGNRPDILLFPKEHKCIIIELKSMDADVSKFVSQVSQYAGLIRQYAKDRFEITTFYAYLIGESFTLNEVKRANPFFKKAYYFDYLFCPNYPVDGGENRRDGEMYIEVIKYSTLLERAVFRNKIFTNKI